MSVTSVEEKGHSGQCNSKSLRALNAAKGGPKPAQMQRVHTHGEEFVLKKIRDLTVGETVEIYLLVKSGSIRLTRAQKPYLAMELFDGNDTISATDWDYGNGEPPAKNAVLSITAQVTEYNNNKQLNIKAMTISDKGVELFAPTGDVDVAYYVSKSKELIEGMTNLHVKEITRRAFYENPVLWKTIPSANGIHHAFIAGNLKHSVDVALAAQALAGLYGANEDLCVAGGLLQDFGKLWTYQLTGAIIEMTDLGQLVEHIAIGIAKLEAYRTPENSAVMDLLQHLVASHHGKIEYGTTATPRFLEAMIVAAADGLDAKAQTIKEANAKAKPTDKFTEKVWAIENRQLFTQHYVWELMQ